MNGSPEGPAGEEETQPERDQERGGQQTGSRRHELESMLPNHRRLRAVSFDVTHTLIEPRAAGAIYAEVLARAGWSLDPEALSGAIRKVWRDLAAESPPGHDRFRRFSDGARGFWRELVRRVLATEGRGAPPEGLVDELYERFAQPAAWTVYPDVPGSLDALRRDGYRLALVSNWDERLEGLLAALGLRAYFEVAFVSGVVGVEKPDARVFLGLVDALGLPPEAVLHVGDSAEEDVAGARLAGLQAVRIDRQRRDGLALHSLGELVDLLVPRPT